MKLSIVTTCYMSSEYINEFCQRVSTVAEQVAEDSYEIIFVNDGSPDDSREKVLELVNVDKHVSLIDLSRNFGHHKAMMTGLAHASGDKIFLIDVDLEEQPEWLIPFTQKMNKEKCDAVFGVQEKRKGNLFERVSGSIFWNFFNFVSRLNITPNMMTARLMTKQFVENVIKHQEREVFAHAIWHITGFNQQPYIVAKGSSSPTTYTLAKKIDLFINAVVSFSDNPLKIIFKFGMGTSLFAFLYILYVVLKRIFSGVVIDGWTSVIASIWLLGGLTIMFIGLIGIYLSKIFLEVKQRPYTIIKQIYTHQDNIKS